MNKNSAQINNLEESILGYFLINEKDWDIWFQMLSEKDFLNPINQIIFSTIKELLDENSKISDTLILTKLASKNKLQEVGGEKKLFELKAKAATKSNLAEIYKIIEENSKLRQTEKLVTQIKKELDSPNVRSESILSMFENQLLEITLDRQTKNFESIITVVDQLLEEIQQYKISNSKRLKGVSTGIAILDNITAGMQRGDLIILAARPSMGKTAFALNLACNVAMNNYQEKTNVVFFSLEMATKQLVARILSRESGVPGDRIKQPNLINVQQELKLKATKNKVASWSFLIDDTPGITLSDIQWKLKKLHKSLKKIDLVIIDYLQLVTSDGNKTKSENRQNEVAKISRTFKQLAREIDAPVIALSQLSRGVEQREDKMPILSDLRESGAIEQDADLIWFLYRESYYNNKKESFVQEVQDVILNIAKHRNGAIGKIILDFNPSLGTFVEKSINSSYTKGETFD